MTDISVPDIGDFKDVEIIEVLVAPGDTVQAEDGIITLETDKATMDVPSPIAGKIAQLTVKVGDKVNEGDVIAKLDSATGNSSGAEPVVAETSQQQPQAASSKAPEPVASQVGNAQMVTVPDIGDFNDVPIIEILVSSGDTVAKEDGLITLETDKATMDVPAPFDGTVEKVLVKVGDKVNQDDQIVSMVTGAQATPDTPATSTPAETPSAPAPAPVQSSGPQTVTVPDIGDFTDVPIIEILVKPGDSVDVEDGILTLETDKATMDVPSPVAGTVDKILVKVGDKVSKDDQIASITGVAQSTPAPTQTSSPAPAPSSAPATPAPAAKQAPATTSTGSSSGVIYASPAVRKLGREFGVDLKKVSGSGAKGRILKEDIQAYVAERLSKDDVGGGMSMGWTYELPTQEEEDYSKYGEVEKVELARIRQISGPTLHRNWLTVPHVTQFDETDVTELEEFRKAHAPEAKEQGFSLSPLAFLVKAVCVALRKYPEFNSSLALDGKSLHIKKYFNIGIAVDTPVGLMVPVIKDADKKTVMQIAQEMAVISKKTREGKVGPKDLKGGTFTISSLGGIGGTHFTPIVNVPEVAILGVGRTRISPVWQKDKFVPRSVLPLAVSYDHRVIDGAKGARFTTHLSELLTDIRNIVL